MEETLVLLVDDEPNILSSLKRLLRKEPYNILTANGGIEGLEILKKNKISLVISDQRMPEMSGVEFLLQVKKLYPETVRMMLSGYTDVESMTNAINEGEVYNFIVKPWKDDDLKLAILRSLEQYDLLEENRRLYEKVKEQNVLLEDLVLNLERTVEARTKDLKMRNKALLASQSIIENVPFGILGIDENDFIVLANKQIHEDLGIEKGATLGCFYKKVLPADLVDAIQKTSLTATSKRLNFSGYRKEMKAIFYCDVMAVGGAQKGVVLVTQNPVKPR